MCWSVSENFARRSKNGPVIIIPAIDLKDGKCVRLLQGEADRETVYSDDPSAVARRWEEAGAERLHVIDLDGAFSGSPKNRETLQSILEAVSIPVQVGGGIRNEETMTRLFDLGAWRVVLGTAAYRDEKFLQAACHEHRGRIAVGVDARNGMMATDGWVKDTGEEAIPFALRCQEAGAAAIIYTDISRDGMLTGPNTEATGEIAQALSIPVVASGGISSLDDIKEVMELEKYGVEGIIVGKALYTGALDLRQAIAATKKG